MAETTLGFLEEWQTGALFLLVSVILGAVLSVQYGPLAGVRVLVAGGFLTFVVLLYLLYGR